MAGNVLRLGAEFLLVSLVVLNLTCDVNAKQVIRLQSGLECPMPGYFRDLQNCRKFYFCPYETFKPHLTAEEKQVRQEITVQGLECPEESFFDESTSACERFSLANIIPPECQYPELLQSQPVELKTGIVPEISHNDH